MRQTPIDWRHVKKKILSDILGGSTAIPHPVNLPPVVENTEDDIKRRNDDLIVHEQIRHGVLKTQRLVERDSREHMQSDTLPNQFRP